MSIASSSIRSALLRSTLRSAASAKAARSPFRLSNQTSLARRTLRCPVEMSCCVESLMPFHNATSSALLISMLSVTRRAYGWVPEACNKDV